MKHSITMGIEAPYRYQADLGVGVLPAGSLASKHRLAIGIRAVQYYWRDVFDSTVTTDGRRYRASGRMVKSLRVFSLVERWE